MSTLSTRLDKARALGRISALRSERVVTASHLDTIRQLHNSLRERLAEIDEQIAAEQEPYQPEPKP